MHGEKNVEKPAHAVSRPFELVLLPLIGCYATLTILLFFLPQQESLVTFCIRLIIGALPLGILTYLILGGGVRRLLHGTGSIIGIVAAIAFGLMLHSLPYYVSLIGVPFPPFTPVAPYRPYFVGDVSLWAAFIILCCYVIAEELYFRGLVYRALRSRAGRIIAFITSTGFFIAMHLTIHPVYILSLTLLSIFSVTAYEYSGSLFLGVLAHLTVNIATVVVAIEEYTPFRSELAGPIALLSAVCCLSVLLHFIFVQYRAAIGREI